MAKYAPSFLLVFLITDTSVLHKISCSFNEVVRFELKTVPQVVLEPGIATPFVSFFKKAEERQKLCFYAKMRANLAYIDYNYVPEWQNYVRGSSSEQILWGMYCSTLPTIYLLRADRSSNVQITFLHSAVDHYVFDKDVIEAISVSRSGTPEEAYLESHAEEAELFKLKIEDERRNLCAGARKYVSVDFLGKDVPEAQLFEFELANEEKKHLIVVAILCHTSPKLYLYRGISENQIKIVLLRDVIDRYEFELDDVKPLTVVPLTGEEQSWMQYFKNTLTREDQATLSRSNQKNETCLTRLNVDERRRLCSIVRRYRASLLVPYVEDVDVKEAQLYSFQYPERRQERNIAILCSALPRMYLRSDHLETSSIKIRITFAPNLADRYIYGVEVPDESFQIDDNGKLDESEYRGLERHSFTNKLNREDLWNFCFAAQKHILKDKETLWNFRFAEQEPIISANKLLLIPTCMNVSRMYGAKFYNSVREVDIFILCSEWPQLYLRLGKSSNDIIAVLNKDDLLR